jgi:hypothetical protein
MKRNSEVTKAIREAIEFHEDIIEHLEQLLIKGEF